MSTATDTKAARTAWIERNPLRRWRHRNEFSLMDAAAILQVGFTTVQLWESGAREPGDDNMEKIAVQLQTDADRVRRSWRRWRAQQP